MVAITRRICVTTLALACSALTCTFAFAQAKPATATTSPPAPAAPAKFIPAVKGLATIEVIRGASKASANKKEMVTVLTIKNTSKGSIALLGVEEFWYNQKREIVSGDSEKVKRLIAPGEIVEVTMSSPTKPGLYMNQHVFTHANGKIDPKLVKKFE